MRCARRCARLARGRRRAGLLRLGRARSGCAPRGSAPRCRPDVRGLVPAAAGRMCAASDALEAFATEYACQGLELDVVGLAWGGDFLRRGRDWQTRRFAGTRWQRATRRTRITSVNTYRVLLTRARYETVIWVPRGSDRGDPFHDATRDAADYDAVADFLLACGARRCDLDALAPRAPLPRRPRCCRLVRCASSSLALLSLLAALPAAAHGAQARRLEHRLADPAARRAIPPCRAAWPRAARRTSPRLRAYARRLDADVVALQEVDGPHAAARVFDPAALRLPLRPARTTCSAPASRCGARCAPRATRISTGSTCAPARARSLRRGTDITVHAPGQAATAPRCACSRSISTPAARPARCDRADAGMRDAAPPGGGPGADWIAARRREGVAFAILGDFNRRMTGRTDEIAARPGRAETPLLRATEGSSNPCWSQCARRAALHRPHPARRRRRSAGSSAIACACWSMPSATRSYRDRLSDHCPVSIRLRLPG